MKKLIDEVKERLTFRMIVIALIVFVGFVMYVSMFGIEFIFPVLFLCALIYFINSSEKENIGSQETKQHQERMSETQKEIEKYEKKLEIIKNHLENKPDDLDAKLRLYDIQEKLNELNEMDEK